MMMVVMMKMMIVLLIMMAMVMVTLMNMLIMMMMTWMTRMIIGIWVDEEDENDEYVDDELRMMSMWRMSMSMTKKMTKRTCESSD